MNAKRVLEINPGHPVIKELLERVKEDPGQETSEFATVLYEAALLSSGYALHDSFQFSIRFFKLFNGAMGISKDAKVEDPVIEIEEEIEEPRDDDDADHVNLDDDDDDHYKPKHSDDDSDKKKPKETHRRPRGNNEDLWEFWNLNIYSLKKINKCKLYLQ